MKLDLDVYLISVATVLIGISCDQTTTVPSLRTTSTATTVNRQSITRILPSWLTTESSASGCILPEQPMEGNYEVVNSCTGSCSNAPGTRVPVGSFLTYSCQNGWALKGNNVSFCSLAGWHMYPTCVKMCNGLQFEGMDITCSYQGERVSCRSKLMPGTQAIRKCSRFFKILPSNSRIHNKIDCLENGSWDGPHLRCIPDCGIDSSTGVPSNIEHGLFPWHVVIWENYNTQLSVYKCAGTLISESLVISAAHCFYDDTLGMKKDARNFTVVAGKYYRPYHRLEQFRQKSAVTKIDLLPRYSGVIGNYAADIALIHTYWFYVNSWVRPICIDWDNRRENDHLQIGSVGKTVVWGKKMDGHAVEVLKEINLPYVTPDQCISAVPRDFMGFVTPDKFCAGDRDGSGPCHGYGGGGLCFQNDGRWYLRGIMSIHPTFDGTCDNNYYTAFTNIGKFMEWIQDIFIASGGVIDPTIEHTTISSFSLTTGNRVDGCILPEQPSGGDYEVVGCGGSCNRTQGFRVRAGSILQYRCREGYAFRGENSSYCTNLNTWLNHPTCVKMCNALQSDSVDIACSYQGKNVSCESKMMPTTKATLACKPFYAALPSSGIVYEKIKCQEDGSWDNLVYHCCPECRRRLSRGTTLIVNGNTASHGATPWHVAIYENYTNGSYQQICAGSLISSKLVLSAAHCFYDDNLRSMRAATQFAVAAGKYYRSYHSQEEAVQKSVVELIRVPERYYGNYRNQAQDIALVRVQTPFILNEMVRPVCIDWENTYEREHLQPMILGTVVGWGITEQHGSSEELREINLPYVSYQQCMSAVPNDFKSFLTPDKFCAGYLNGTSLCNSDSGGGLTFPHGDSWFLRGIVSVSPSNGSMCDNRYYTAFTNVKDFREWIQDALNNLG